MLKRDGMGNSERSAVIIARYTLIVSSLLKKKKEKNIARYTLIVSSSLKRNISLIVSSSLKRIISRCID